MARPEILQIAPMLPVVTDQIAKLFTVHRFWEVADKEAWLAENGSRIRGVAAGGHSPINETLLGKLPSLEIVAAFGVGYDQIDAKWAGNNGIVVTNTPDVLTDEVADLTIGLLISTVRRIPAAERHLRDGKWPSGAFQLTSSLRDRKIGILGLGRIGKAIAKRLQAFGLPISYYGRHKQDGVEYAYVADPVELARQVDVLISVIPGGKATEKTIGAAVFEALGPDGIFLNVGRGTVVDEAALIDALKSNKIQAAGLDVYADEPNVPAELMALENTVLLPHVASGTVHTRNAMGQLVVDNLVSWFDGRGAVTPVAETAEVARTKGSKA
ncbi:glycerate dehydrogenase [Skermanella aerolata]|uniref:Glycerate dehydrogenase n=1 Tax=Skermanella aerolata TaxID=393310 RepID=A0A512DMB8_9PROT|nr:2-hydroxyacid dehydrogenase [Skermanella aerolata]KJB96499.1 dihydrofolate reductase [Skermanella aerolata KACC 11604]GEO37614.1 glycerate dehydrogenase [Skermanella aerolata]